MERLLGKIKAKEKVIVDTCIHIKYLRNDIDAINELLLLMQNDRVVLSPIVYAEIMNGTSKKLYKPTKEWLNKFVLVLFDDFTALKLVELSNSNTYNSKTTLLGDAIIGLTAA